MSNIGSESILIESKAQQLQILENTSMYKQGLFEMANYQPKDSGLGLPYAICFDEIGNRRKHTHSEPRVKILMSNDDLIPVLISVKPKILLKGVQLSKANRILKGKNKDIMFEFISNNHELILKHWHGKITTMELLLGLK